MDSKIYGYFIGILIIDSNQSGSEKTDPNQPKISKYLLDPNV